MKQLKIFKKVKTMEVNPDEKIDNSKFVDPMETKPCGTCGQKFCANDSCVRFTYETNNEAGKSNEPSRLREIWENVCPDWMLGL